VILAISLLAEDISAQVLFENVSIYNGKSSALSQPINVLIDGNPLADLNQITQRTEIFLCS
jgi:hypothetical protein